MKYTVVFTGELPPIARSLLAGEFDVIEHAAEPERSEDELITLLDEADAAIAMPTDPLTRRVLEESPSLRMIALVSSGCENVDLDAARDLGIRVAATPDARTAAEDIARFLRGGQPLHAVV